VTRSRSNSAEGGATHHLKPDKNLPAGLAGGNTCVIKGFLKEFGLYSFSAYCGDSKGLKTESFCTLNIQPDTLIKTNNTIDVPDCNVSVVYDIQQVAQ
jgi:hypothetical protein